MYSSGYKLILLCCTSVHLSESWHAWYSMPSVISQLMDQESLSSCWYQCFWVPFGASTLLIDDRTGRQTDKPAPVIRKGSLSRCDPTRSNSTREGQMNRSVCVLSLFLTLLACLVCPVASLLVHRCLAVDMLELCLLAFWCWSLDSCLVLWRHLISSCYFGWVHTTQSTMTNCRTSLPLNNCRLFICVANKVPCYITPRPQ